MKILRQLLADEQATALNEYALLLALIAIATIISITALRDSVVGSVGATSDGIADTSGNVAQTMEYTESVN
jgi:Flp pilus assembly pilin Flp